MRVGADPDAPWVDRHVPLHAHDSGFDLHVAVHVDAGDRERLERLCQYLYRPPLGQGRLNRLLDGRIAVALQRPWADGTTHLVSLLQPLSRVDLRLAPGYRMRPVLRAITVAPSRGVPVVVERRLG